MVLFGQQLSARPPAPAATVIVAPAARKVIHRAPEVLAGVLALTASLLAPARGGGFAVTALSIRNLDESVKARLQSRAARHGRSMEAEARAILTEAVREPAESAGLFTALLDRFAVLGGVDLQLPDRDEPARAADFTA